MNLVSCSNCGQEFQIEGRQYGFSHCDTHADYEPVPDKGLVAVITADGGVHQGTSDHPAERYTMAAYRFGNSLNSDEVFVLFDAAGALPDKWDEATQLLCNRLRSLTVVPGPREALLAAIRSIRHQWGPAPRLSLTKANLAGCHQLVAADLRGATLTEATLDGANLTYADLRGAQFGKGVWMVNLTGADLRGAEFDTDAYLDTSILDAARLDGVELSGAALGSANKAWMRGINLHNARLTGSLLVQCRLSSANLSHADLSGAYLTEAWLDGANLSRADLCGTDLTAADLTGAVLDGIRWDSATRWPANFTPPPSR